MASTVFVRVAVLLAASLQVRADEPPVAPSPEAGFGAAGVVAVAHQEADSRQHVAGAHESKPAAVLGPIALPPSTPAAGGPAAPPRPLPDWRLLAALGGAFAAMAAYRVLGGRRSTPLPPDVFELLGEASLGGQHSVRVVRFGPRTLLVAVSSSGARTLAELVDPQATERIVAACQGGPARNLGRPRKAASQDAAAEARS
ncbi:MAG: flagellar biosynthetic protein FliO [Planctomycetes bacterium]|nr:flagellar biosynthetic protein FliO [Planctomycetota bacterium]